MSKLDCLPLILDASKEIGLYFLTLCQEIQTIWCHPLGVASGLNQHPLLSTLDTWAKIFEFLASFNSNFKQYTYMESVACYYDTYIFFRFIYKNRKPKPSPMIQCWEISNQHHANNVYLVNKTCWHGRNFDFVQY